MSVVTGITIISQCCDERAIGDLVERLNLWVHESSNWGKFKRVDDYYGGPKHPECLVWGAGFNHLDWSGFIKFAQSLPWKEALTLPEEEEVILVVCLDQRKAVFQSLTS